MLLMETSAGPRYRIDANTVRADVLDVIGIGFLCHVTRGVDAVFDACCALAREIDRATVSGSLSIDAADRCGGSLSDLCDRIWTVAEVERDLRPLPEPPARNKEASMTLADAFSAAPHTTHRAALLAAFAGVQSALSDAESAKVMSGPVAAALVDQLCDLACRVASEVRAYDAEPSHAEQAADDPAPPAATGPEDGPAGTENALRDVPDEAPAVTPETEPADVAPPADPDPKPRARRTKRG